MADAAVAEMQRQCVRELTSLRDQLDESEDEKALLRRKVRELTAHLTETTQELAQRSALFSDAAERADQLETLVGDAKKTLLTREMRVHELTQQVQALETTLHTEQKAKDHWEREFIAARDDVARLERQVHQLKQKLEDRGTEVSGWKAKVKLAMNSLHELRAELEVQRGKETKLEQELARLKSDRSESERRLNAKVDKRDKAVAALQQQLEALRDAQASVDERAREMDEKEMQWRSSEATQQFERRRQLLALQDQLQHACSELEKAKMHDMLAQRELCRLREELLLSESQRKTEQRRHEQQLKGKEKEMAFVWQKYVNAMTSRGATTGMSQLPLRHEHIHAMR